MVISEGVTSVSLPNTMEILRDGVFYNTVITEIYIPDSVLDDKDVVQLLWHTLFSEAYPIG